MEKIHFTTRVLGAAAAYLGRVSAGDRLEVLLDSISIGKAELVSMDAVTWEALDDDDARRGGFSNRFYLGLGLQRAGFRFLPLNKYELYRIQFTWLEKKIRG